MSSPRWSYSQSNADRWRTLLDQLMANGDSVSIPLDGNSKSLPSLKIRISEAAKWLSDQFKIQGKEEFRKYHLLKKQLRFDSLLDNGQEFLVVKLRRGIQFEVTSKQSPATDNQKSPSGLDDWAIERLFQTMKDENQPMEFRKKIAKTLIEELQASERTNVDRGIILTEAASCLLQGDPTQRQAKH